MTKKLFRRTRRALLVLTVLLSFPLPARAADKSEGERREEKWRQNAEKVERELGTRDLTELYRRAVQIRANEVARERAQRSGQKHKAVNADGDITWTNLGPTFNPTFTSPVNTAKPNQHDTGLITAIAPHPTDPNILVVGSAGGGLWRSTNKGENWTPVAGDLPAGALQIGAVSFAPSDANRVYAGTGCGDASTTKIGSPDFAVRSSIGALRSDDGGVTWTATKTSPPAEFYWRLSVSPTNPNDVLAATNKGIYRTTDGGETWTAVLDKVADISGIRVVSLSRTGTGGNTVFASLYKPGEVPGLIFRSDDGGATWAAKSAGWPGTFETRGRVMVSASPTNPGRVYAIICGLDEKQVDVIKSEDGGDTWTALGLDPTKVKIVPSQADFAMSFAVDPANPDIVYAGGLDVWRTMDAGATWTQLSDWSPPGSAKFNYMHADQHAVVFGADGTVYFGNDGGIYRMTTDATPDFVGLNRDIVSWLVDEICASADGAVILNGAQDNGTSLRVSGTEWRQVGGGDGYSCLVNPADPKTWTISVQNNGIQRTTNSGVSFDNADGLNENDKNKLFRTILRQHPTEASRIFTATKRKIWQSNDSGANWFDATKEMPLIDSIVDFWISSADGNRMLIVDKKGQVLESTDAGANWARIGEYPLKGAASTIRGERDNPNVIYVTSKTPAAGKERVWKSSDKGQNWEPVSRTGQTDGLPDMPIFTFAIDPKSTSVLWAGTFIGVYRSANGGQTWQRHGTNLPNVPITDMIFVNDGAKVIIGTAGRGLYEASAGTRPSSSPSSPASSISVKALAAQFSYTPSNPRPGRSIQFVEESTGGAQTWSWNFAGQKTSTEPFPTHIFANPGPYSVTLTVTDGKGGSATVTKEVTVAYPDTGTGSVLTYLVPVLVRANGRGGEQFDTELTMTNRAGKAVQLTFTFKSGDQEQTATYEMAAGQEIVPAFDFLTARGMTFPAQLAGTLRIAVSGASNVSEFSAQSRVLTPPTPTMTALDVKGKFGLAYPATPLTAAASKEAVLYGLQETASARSNVACVNAGGSASPGEITLELRYRNGETGTLSDKIERTFKPFEFFQWNAPLNGLGYKQGWVQIKRVAGNDQFLCYATIVDNTNGDGAYVPMSIVDTKLAASEVMVPVVLDAGGYKSELTLSNRSLRPVEGEFAVIKSNGEEEWGEFEIPALSQVILDDIIGELRNAGFNTPANTIASMYFSFEVQDTSGPRGEESDIDVSASDVYVGVRTYEQPGGGEKGRFGLAYGYLPLGQAADTVAYIYGLQQTGERNVTDGTRSSISFIHALGGDIEDLELEVSFYGKTGEPLLDGSGNALKRTITLKPGQWLPWNFPLTSSPGAEQGFAKVVRTKGSDQFITYGVLNDQRNNDGAFISMIVP